MGTHSRHTKQWNSSRVDHSSDRKYRYNKVSLSIDTSGQSSILSILPLHENSKKISGNLEEILEENGKILK